MAKKDWIGTWRVRYCFAESDYMDTSGELYEDDHLIINEDGTFDLEYTGGTFEGKWKSKGSGIQFLEIDQLGCDTLQSIESDGKTTIRATVTDDEHGIEIRYNFEKKK